MLTRNFYNIGFTPANISNQNSSQWQCSFVPCFDENKEETRVILNTDGKRIISYRCTVTETNEDASSKFPNYADSLNFSGGNSAFYPFMLASTQMDYYGTIVISKTGLNSSSGKYPKLNSDQFKIGYTESISISGYNCNAFIILGSGSTNPTIDDYKLENCNLDYSVSEYKQSYNNVQQIANVSITIIPNIDGGIVKEIGVYTLNTSNSENLGPDYATIVTSNTNQYKNCCCMIARSVLDNPITLEVNKPYTFTYTIDYGKMSDRVA